MACSLTQRETVLAGIAASALSHAERRALTMVYLGLAKTVDDLYPAVWNREAKARKAVASLASRNHLTREDGLLFVLENSFPLQPGRDAEQQMQLGTVAPGTHGGGLGTALAEVLRVEGQNLSCPGQDRMEPEKPAETPAKALSCPGPDGPVQDRTENSDISGENSPHYARAGALDDPDPEQHCFKQHCLEAVPSEPKKKDPQSKAAYSNAGKAEQSNAKGGAGGRLSRPGQDALERVVLECGGPVGAFGPREKGKGFWVDRARYPELLNELLNDLALRRKADQVTIHGPVLSPGGWMRSRWKIRYAQKEGK